MKEAKTTRLKYNNGTARELYSVQIERMEGILESVIEFQTKRTLKSWIVERRKKAKKKLLYRRKYIWRNDYMK